MAIRYPDRVEALLLTVAVTGNFEHEFANKIPSVVSKFGMTNKLFARLVQRMIWKDPEAFLRAGLEESLIATEEEKD